MAYPLALPTFAPPPPIMIYGQPCLRGICEAVPTDYPVAALEAQIFTLYAALSQTNASSISAPQIGWRERVFVTNWAGGIFINPEVDYTNFDPTSLPHADGCISIPGYGASVPRYTTITLKYETLTGTGANLARSLPIVNTFTGDQAYVVQHELDHLNGILFIDHLDNSNATTPPLNKSLGYASGLSNLNDAMLRDIAAGNYSVNYNTLPLQYPCKKS